MSAHSKLSYYIFVLVYVVSCFSVQAKDVYEIVVDKPGKVSKLIKKDELPSVKVLTIKGEINNKDIAYISQCTELTTLDISDTDFDKQDYDEKKGQAFYSGNGIKLPSFTKLKKLISKSGWIKNIHEFSTLKTWVLVERTADALSTLNLDTLAIVKRGYQDKPLSQLIANEQPSDKYVVERFIDRFFIRRNPFELEDNHVKAKVFYTMMEDSYNPSNYFDAVNPCIIIARNHTYLYRWDASLTDEQLNDVDILFPYAYLGARLEEITIPPKVSVLPRNLFSLDERGISDKRKDYSSKLKENSSLTYLQIEEKFDVIAAEKFISPVKRVNLSNIKDIGEKPFENTPYLTDIDLPATLTRIHENAFDECNIKDARFHSSAAPEVYGGNYLSVSTGVRFIVPQGMIKKFRIGPWNNTNDRPVDLVEEGAQNTYNFVIKTPGTLAEYLTDDIAYQVEYLTLSGPLYDTDMEAIKKCKFLRVLDMGKCFTSVSPETIEQNRKQKKALAAYLGLVLNMAAEEERNKVETGNGSIVSAEYTKVIANKYNDLMSQYDANTEITADPSCVLPVKAFDGLKYIERMVYPVQMETLLPGVSSLNLTDLVLPPGLVDLCGHFKCPKLKEIKFPTTLKVIEGYAFSGCTSLTEIDLRNTKVEKIYQEAFKDAPIRVFKASPYLELCKGSYGECVFSRMILEGWFYTQEKPSMRDSFRLIHIPNGCKAGWVGCNADTVVDDIEL